jgi:hypothetical protein
MNNRIHIIGGGTFSHVRNHLALAAPAFGSTARKLYSDIFERLEDDYLIDYGIGEGPNGPPVEVTLKNIRERVSQRVTLHLTKMAAPRQSNLVTNDDVSKLIDTLIADPETRVIIMNAALCDYDGTVLYSAGGLVSVASPLAPSGSHAPRLKTADGLQMMRLSPADKIIGRIRKERKDIFVVGFKTTTGATSDEQYAAGLHLLKGNSLNLVLANDTVTRNNMIVAPEETRYCETTDRDTVLEHLAKMVMSRSQNTFTRSTVVEGEGVAWDSDLVPNNLREVVDHCIEAGAYKPFRGATVGHFAVRVNDSQIITSGRKRNFNNLRDEGMVLVDYEGDDRVIARGGKPSVGGQSQRIVFREHPELDCIVHFHCPPLPGAELSHVDQTPNECGSHQCGQATSRGLRPVGNGKIKAVMLDNHGPNIVFSRETPANDVIEFIERNFDLKQKTGGIVA